MRNRLQTVCEHGLTMSDVVFADHNLRKDSPGRTPDPKQRWLTFVRNDAKVMVGL